MDRSQEQFRHSPGTALMIALTKASRQRTGPSLSRVVRLVPQQGHEAESMNLEAVLALLNQERPAIATARAGHPPHISKMARPQCDDATSRMPRERHGCLRRGGLCAPHCKESTAGWTGSSGSGQRCRALTHETALEHGSDSCEHAAARHLKGGAWVHVLAAALAVGSLIKRKE